MARTLISAHQTGFEQAYGPNSLQAALAVRDDGVDMIEFDVRVTKDGKFVTLHDAFVTIDTMPRAVEELSADAVLLHAPEACLLEVMLRAVKDHAIAHVDLKDTTGEIAVVDMCESIVGSGGYIITTLEDQSVRKIRTQRPHVPVGLSLGRDTRGMPLWRATRVRLSEIFPARRVSRCQPTLLALNYRLAKYGTLRWAKRRRLPVLLWTIDSPRLMHKIWQNPYVWAFTTNNPRHAIAVTRGFRHESLTSLLPEIIG